MDYPNDREVLETFECDQPVSFKYAPHSECGGSTDTEAGQLCIQDHHAGQPSVGGVFEAVFTNRQRRPAESAVYVTP